MRSALISFTAAITLFFSGDLLALEKKQCGPGEQEVMAKDRTTMCVKAYGGRPDSKGHVAYQGPQSASANPTK
jgi:hypothetical protein